MRTLVPCFYSDLVSLATWLSSVQQNSYDVWRDILNPEKMMDGEALMVLLEWAIYGFSDEKK